MANKRLAIAGLLAVLMLLIVPAARGNVTVLPMIVDLLGAENAVGQFRVASQSDAVQYLEITVKKVIDPATPEEHEVAVDPIDESGLMASPRRIVLPSGASRVVRLVQLTPPAAEAVYRVYVSPVSAPYEASLESGEREKGVHSKLELSVSWGVLVYAKPVKQVPSIALDAQRMHLLNDGNVRVRMRRIGRCEKNLPDVCRWKKIERNVFPGQLISIPYKKYDGEIIRAEFESGSDGKREKVWP